MYPGTTKVLKVDCVCQGDILATIYEHDEWLCIGNNPGTSLEFREWLMPSAGDAYLLLATKMRMEQGWLAEDTP